MRFEGSGMEDEWFGSKDVYEGVYSGAATLQKLMDVEAALAYAEHRAGIISEEVAEEIIEKCDVNLLDEELYTIARKKTGHPLMGLLQAYKAVCSPTAGQYIHYGATTQDISDTAMILQMREVYRIVEQKARRVREQLVALAVKHRNTVMIGRTNDQQGIPITLGFKFATWIDELDRALERMEESKKRIFVVEFAGAVGTMASLGSDGLSVQKYLAERLELGQPRISWFATRDRTAEYVWNLAMLTAALGRMGNEVYNEQRSEVNELAEGFALGKVGSSTMPHKRNPFLPGRMAARGRIAQSYVSRAMQAIENTNERDCRVLCFEPYHLKEIACLADGTLDVALELFEHLEVHEENIARNLEILHGLIFSEALMMRLAKTFGRMEAHDIIYEKSMQAISERRNLKELLLADDRIADKISEEELNSIMNPANYIGLAPEFVDAVVGTLKN